jgi:hypothetical protein
MGPVLRDTSETLEFTLEIPAVRASPKMENQKLASTPLKDCPVSEVERFSSSSFPVIF